MTSSRRMPFGKIARVAFEYGGGAFALQQRTLRLLCSQRSFFLYSPFSIP